MPSPDDIAASPEGDSAADPHAVRPRSASNHVLSLGSLVVDVAGRVATRDGRVLKLLPKQFALLVYLLEHANRIVSRQAIARDVWGDATAVWTNVITVNINALRNVIERDDLPRLLHTVRGRGYLLGELPE